MRHEDFSVKGIALCPYFWLHAAHKKKMSFTLLYITPLQNFHVCVAHDPSNLVHCLTGNSFALTLATMLFFTFISFVAWAITGNISWVDRLWSIIPIVYAWMIAGTRQFKWMGPTVAPSGTPGFFPVTARTQMAILVSLWGLRLTYNLYRKGGYSKGFVDYRWDYVARLPILKSRIAWFLFNVAFVALYQNFILWMIVLPLRLIPHRYAAEFDHCVAVLFLLLLLVETIADQQQSNFQAAKRDVALQLEKLALDYKMGFLTHGLFSRSRHPNIWAEQNIWMTLFGASLFYKGFNWSFIGCILLVLLTIASTNMTEKISASKYPLYRVYRMHVPMLVPRMLFGSRKAFDEDVAKALQSPSSSPRSQPKEESHAHEKRKEE